MSDINTRVDLALGVLGAEPRATAILCSGCFQPLAGDGLAVEGSEAVYCSSRCLARDLEAVGRHVRAGEPIIGDRYEGGEYDRRLHDFVVLHLGCGRKQRLDQLPPIRCYTAEGDETFPAIRLINLDGLASVGAHLTATLGVDAIALPDDSVDLILATHVLEHIGRQGELAGWFQFWGEAYRVLKPGGRLQFFSPYHTSVWCWADPTHTRALSEYAFLYLNQDSYRVPAERTAIPDYRPPCDFELAHWTLHEDTNPDVRRVEARSHIAGVLVARKPFRPYWEEAR